MRTFAAAFTAAIRSGHFEPFLAVKLETTPTPVRLTTLPSSTTINGAEYLSVSLEDAETPTLSALPKRDSLQFRLDDSGDYNHLLGVSHVDAEIGVGTTDHPTSVEWLFPGTMLGAIRVVDFEEERRSIVIDVDIVGTGLDATVKRNTTPEYQRRIDVDDTCFNGVYTDAAQRVDNYWGRRA